MTSKFIWPLIVSSLLFLQLTCERAHSGELRDVMRSRSTAELKRTLDRTAHRHALRDDCDGELASVHLPRSCFKALEMDPPASVTNEMRWLSRLCERRARSTARLEDLRDLQDLPFDCRSIAIQRRDDLRYQLEERRPQHLFQEHVRSADLGSDLE